MITVNGKEVTLTGPLSVADYLEQNNYQIKRIAVEMNGDILPKYSYSDTMLKDGDRLEVVSFVVVDITNLNRQQYFMEHIGMYKTDALKSLLLKINPYLDIRTDCVKVTDDNLQELFADATIVCEAFDNPEAKAMLVNGILEHFPEKKLVSATGMAGYGSSNTIITKRIMKNFYLCGDGVTAPTYGHGLMAPRVAICAAHEANMITRLILGEEEI